MEEAIWGFIGVIVGSIIGTITSIYTTNTNNKNNLSILKKTEENNRKEEFRKFQRDNLLEIQEYISRSIELYFKAQVNHTLTESLDKITGTYFTDMIVKIERVENINLRSDLKEFQNILMGRLTSKSLDEQEQTTSDTEFLNDHEIIIKKIGEALLSYY